MKKLVLPGIIILAVIMLIGSVIGVSKAIFTNRFAAEIAAIKAKGEPVTMQELIGDPIPDDQNGAVPYMQLTMDMRGSTYKQALKTIGDFPSSPGAGVGADSWAKAEAALAKTLPLRSLVDDAASRPKCRFEVNMSAPFATPYPQFSALRKAQQMLRVSALVNARNGRMEQAEEDIITQIGVAQSMRNEPCLIGYLVRIALLGITTKSIQAVSEYDDLSEAQARRMFDALGRTDMKDSARCAWEGERVQFITLSDPKYLQSTVSTVTGSASVLIKPASSLWGQTVVRGDLAVYLGYISRQIDCAKLSFAEAKARGLLEEPRSFPIYATLAKSMIPVMSKTGMRRYATDTEVAKTRVFLALQAYKARYHGYPASMKELKSKLGWKLPTDPFSGKDFIYKRQAKGFILYSVGPDLKDNGGRSLGDSVELESKGDIVLRWNR